MEGKKKYHKYNDLERNAIYKSNNQQVREVAGYFLNIKGDKDAAWWNDLKQKESLSALEIDRLMKFMDNRLVKISIEISGISREIQDVEFDIATLEEIRPQDESVLRNKIADLKIQKKALLSRKQIFTTIQSIYNSAHGHRATQEIETQLNYNLEKIKEGIHDQLSEVDESFEKLDEFLRGGEAQSTKDLDKEPEVKIKTVDGVEIPKIDHNAETIEMIGKREEKIQEINTTVASADFVTPISRNNDYQNWDYIKDKSKRRHWKLQQND